MTKSVLRRGPGRVRKGIFSLIFLPLLLLAGLPAFADQQPESPATRQALAKAITAEGDQQIKDVTALADTHSDLVRKVLNAWPLDELYIIDAPDGSKIPCMLDDAQDADGKQKAIRIDTGAFLNDASGKPQSFFANDLTSVDTDMRLRRAIQDTLDLMALSDPNPEARKNAVMKLGMLQKLSYVPILEARLAKETNGNVRAAIGEAVATIELKDPDSAVQIAAIQKLGELGSMGSRDVMQSIIESAKTNPAEMKAAKKSLALIDAHIARVNFFGTIFRGLSLGSILLVVAIGLAITFGLMGVINMAHGELIAVGAYTCYVVENVFSSGLWLSPFGFSMHLPGLNLGGWMYQSYFVFAIIASFITAALVGIVLEVFVIRFLYRRPLESLLATWGVSLILQQLFHLVFGAANVQVNSPAWLSGNFTIDDVTLGYNRIFVIGFAAVIVLCTWLLLTKTPLGLLIRAVMQNRNMAACMGVRTERVNMLTFAFGSGLAGLAGAFLSQIGNVGPSLGQNYIVDCFMTVVVGGVGNLFGTVYSALGIGTVDEILQQVFGSPVVGKITVLVCIILFLQWRPSGLFATKGRGLEG
ncbi:MAG TPA: urea ABC transporter permease subunit UrtB [Chthoniobacteraceae bacterium]|jgi:urea transport system permease protein|nr:urea ABC transporter permease subunit UrtB [Chthoniobacteraceae bacterium]